MKATGIVRRIDELGRVVIPKENRRTQRIRRGDPLEIFTTGDGEVIFKKYSPIGEMSTVAAQYTEVLNKSFALTAFVADRDHILAVSGAGRRELADRSSMARKTVAVRGFFAWAYEHGLTTTDPAATLMTPSIPSTLPAVLTEIGRASCRERVSSPV